MGMAKVVWTLVDKGQRGFVALILGLINSNVYFSYRFVGNNIQCFSPRNFSYIQGNPFSLAIQGMNRCNDFCKITNSVSPLIKRASRMCCFS